MSQESQRVIDQLEQDFCQCGAGTDRTKPKTWEYCGIHRTIRALRRLLQAPSCLISDYDEAVDKAHSVGAFKKLKNAEATLGRWYVEHLFEKPSEELKTVAKA